MKKVYVVMEYEIDAEYAETRFIRGIFSTKELAEKEGMQILLENKTLVNLQPSGEPYYDIDEWTLDEPNEWTLAE